jgi:uncharacterized protein (DUF1778 family)
MGAKKTRGPGRPKKDRPLDGGIRVRLNSEDEDLIQRAATKVMAPRGKVEVSAWMREVVIREAREVLGEEEG